VWFSSQQQQQQQQQQSKQVPIRGTRNPEKLGSKNRRKDKFLSNFDEDNKLGKQSIPVSVEAATESS